VADIAPLRRRQGGAVIRSDCEVEPLAARRRRPMQPELRRLGEMRRRGFISFRQLGRDDDMARRGDADAMGERWAGQVRVEQRDNPADLSDAEPDRKYSGRFGIKRQTVTPGTIPSASAQRA